MLRIRFDLGPCLLLAFYLLGGCSVSLAENVRKRKEHARISGLSERSSKLRPRWSYWACGIHAQHGLTQIASNGYLGVDENGVCVLFDNECNEIDRAHLTQAKVRLSRMKGDKLTLDKSSYALEFASLGRATAGRAFGLIGALAASRSSNPDRRSPEEKRRDFQAVVEQLPAA